MPRAGFATAGIAVALAAAPLAAADARPGTQAAVAAALTMTAPPLAASETRPGTRAARAAAPRGEERPAPSSAAAGHASVELFDLSPNNSTLAPTARGWAERVASARRYAARRPGAVAFALRTPARVHGVGVDRVFVSASVVKAMLLVAYARSAGDRALSAEERALLDPMIRRSDNDAANAIFVRVGTGGLRRLARAAGMSRFAPATPIWGHARITARDQTRFFLRLDRLLPARHRAYGLRLLRTIASSQRWGIGRLPLPDWRVHFKGGWGAGTGAIDHQVALLTRGDERIAVAVLTAANGSHAAGKQTLEGIFRRLLRGV